MEHSQRRPRHLSRPPVASHQKTAKTSPDDDSLVIASLAVPGMVTGTETVSLDLDTHLDTADAAPATRAEQRRRTQAERSTTRRRGAVRSALVTTVVLAGAGLVGSTGVFSSIASAHGGDNDLTMTRTRSDYARQQPMPTRPTWVQDAATAPTVAASPSTVAAPSASASSTAAASTNSGAAASGSTFARTVLTGKTVGGWYAGASGIGVQDGSFSGWLGAPVSVTATWGDTDDENQRELWGVTSEYAGWKGAIDVAVGGTVLGSGENYAAAASGAYDDRWRAAAANLAKARGGSSAPTFVRPFHEMNGDWYGDWMVTADNSADFKKAFARYVGILRAAMPQVYIAWSPNFSDHTGLPVDAWYPGDDVVDVIAPDYYDDGNGEDRVNIAAWNAASDDKDDKGNPKGPEAWRQFALAHGKPMAFPEWGLKPEGDGVDHPEWIKAVNAWMNRNANKATWTLGEEIPSSADGKVLYSVYFNVVHEGQSGFTIYGTGANPAAASAFQSLNWGNVS